MGKLEKLTKTSDAKIQEWLRKIDPDDLKKALLVVDKEVRDRVYRNMSPRAVGVLQEYIGGEHTIQERRSAEDSIKRLEKIL